MVQHADIDHTGLTGVGGGVGSVLQVVTAVFSGAANTTTSTTYQASSLSATITPQRNNSKLLIRVDGEFNAYRVAGTVDTRYGWVAIQNTTDAVQVCEGVRGVSQLVAATTAPVQQNHPIALGGVYTVNSTAARTFQLQFKSGLATNIEVSVRGDRAGGLLMSIMEIRV